MPFDQTLDAKIVEARRRVEQQLVDEDDFDQQREGRTAGDLAQELLNLKPETEDLVLRTGTTVYPISSSRMERFTVLLIGAGRESQIGIRI